MEYIVILIIICIIILLIINNNSFGVQKIPIKPLKQFTIDLDISKKKNDDKTEVSDKLLQPSEISSITNVISSKKIKSSDVKKSGDYFYLKGPNETQVYHIFDNAYTYNEAVNECKKNDARLATPDELKDVYDNGGYWCSWGWASDGHAYMPNNDPKCNEDMGLLSGANLDPYLKLGVNCYGTIPKN